MKYIFIAGAPGSKWSSVAKNIYYSPDIDRSDSNHTRSYASDAAYNGAPMHLGSYFDPGMEFGTWFDQLSNYSKQECEAEFDRPFTGTGVRIIKSHMFTYHIDFLKRTWPDCCIVMVHRNDDACLGWWVRCGGFDISYPNYLPYYCNLSNMAVQIDQQNADLMLAWNKYDGNTPLNNYELADLLGLDSDNTAHTHNYKQADIKVKVI